MTKALPRFIQTLQKRGEISAQSGDQLNRTLQSKECCLGDRQADQIVRQMLVQAGGRTSSVLHVNSLMGACLVQGALAAHLGRTAWPGASITEAHPKALLHVSMPAADFIESIRQMIRSDHERDAALAAFSALHGVRLDPAWRDLRTLERGVWFPREPVSYWFPKEVGWRQQLLSACCLTGKCYPIASCGVLPNLFRSSISNQSHPGHPCGGEAVAQSPRPKAGEKSVAGGCCGSVIRLMSSWSLTGQFLLSPVAGL